MRRPESFEEKLFWFLVAAYVGEALGVLDKDKSLRLTHLGEQYGGELTWRQHVEAQLGINKAFIRSVFKAASKVMNREESLCFIMHGFGCLSAESRLDEVLGDALGE